MFSAYMPHSLFLANFRLKLSNYRTTTNAKLNVYQSQTYNDTNTALKDLKRTLCRSPDSLKRVTEHSALQRSFFDLKCFANNAAICTFSKNQNFQITSADPSFFTTKRTKGHMDFKPTFQTLTHLGLHRTSTPLLSIQQLEVSLVRYLKTDRHKQPIMKRNPTLIAKLKAALGFGVPVKSKTEVETLERTLKELMEKTRSKEWRKNAEKNIKIAFAEGYLTATKSATNGNPGRGLTFLKVFQHIVVIAVFLGLFISLFYTPSDSVFKMQMGSQSEVAPDDLHINFEDVKGCDEAKQELKEVVEFLRNPERFSNLGGKLPKGVLLVGPPGTGKTLLARAVAGEANVPFFHVAGSEFDEVLVGQGARRVRDLFKAAKLRSPCVIFIDEIDSVGGKRTNSVLHPYANQTINQLLSEMDGFHQNAGVIVLGATNRRDDLDQALLRPGRFDMEVRVSRPDFKGRRDILSLYLLKILHDRVDLDALARGTAGFTGADLENMVNQAALRAAIDGADAVTMRYLESARDKLLMGPERKSKIPDAETNLITAYHEGGHAIVAYYTKECDPLHKVTIMPRGSSLGHTASIPEKERFHVTKARLLALMDSMLGGRAAEEIIFGVDKITSGASSDLQQATYIATQMVKDWGMSEKVGLRTIVVSKGYGTPEDMLAPNTREAVDSEIKRILNESYERAKLILRKHGKELKALAEALLKYETLDADDIKAIMNHKAIKCS